MIPVIKASRVAAAGVTLRQHPRRAPVPARTPAASIAAQLTAPLAVPFSGIGDRGAGDALPNPAAEDSPFADTMSTGAAPFAASAPVCEDPYTQGYDAGFAAGRQEGWEAGHEQGLHAGLQQGRQDADEATRTKAGALDTLAAAIAEAVARHGAAVEAGAIDIAFAALLRLIGQSAGDLAVVTDTVRRVLEQAPERALQAIRLSPADHALVVEGGHDLSPANVLLLADERVSAGGCIIDTDAGSLDGRLDTQLFELKTMLVELHRARGAQP